jgi:phosphoribosylanthranilate isomerase
MKVKICGMRERENVMEVARLQPDLMGFIFYEKSKRYVFRDGLDSQPGFDSASLHLPVRKDGGSRVTATPESKKIEKVAVFVNEDVGEVIRICKEYEFGYAQLHGEESVDECRAIRTVGIRVIKAFPVADHIDFEKLKAYQPHVDLFLFDTKSEHYGGSGKQFDWDLLESYPLETPYLLSGGIGIEDIQTIKDLDLPNCAGVDANSQLEIEPGLKHVEATRSLISEIRNR